MKHTTTSKNPLCECDNCGYRARYNSLPRAKDIEERCADPRDEYSDVECPQCGALCFEVASSSLVNAVRQLRICGGSGGYAIDDAVRLALSRALNGKEQSCKEALQALLDCPIITGMSAGIRNWAKREGKPDPLEIARKLV